MGRPVPGLERTIKRSQIVIGSRLGCHVTHIKSRDSQDCLSASRMPLSTEE
jgi:hypothetical protein